MKEITINEQTYRVKPMNAIEVLAFQSQINLSDYKSALRLYSLILEKMEVKCVDKWLPVKEENKNVYYPAGIENDVKTVDGLINFFLNEFLKPVFTNSNE